MTVDIMREIGESVLASIIEKCAGAVDVTDGARLESRGGCDGRLARARIGGTNSGRNFP